MTGQDGAAGEIALRLAEIAVSAESARERDAGMMRLLRERLGAAYVSCSRQITRAGQAQGMRLRASDVDAIDIHPVLTQAARQMAREWLAAGKASLRVLNDPRFSGWQVAGCLPQDGLIIIAVWPPHGDATTGAEVLSALAPLLSLAIGGGVGRSGAQSSRGATADAAKAGFVSLVSHAMRTPLNTLTGFIEIVLDQPVGPLNDRQREFLEYARASGQALTQLVEDVTLLSRADEGSLIFRCAPLDSLDVARRALRTVETAADARNVRLSLRVEGESLTLEGDGERLTHALAKLLENAVKFSPESGAVILRVSSSECAVQFVVSDDGPGVAPEEVERIFTRFTQSERTTKNHPGGYGLGLAVALVIARAHSGEIRVESAAEQGATFTLIVPIGTGASANQRTATKSRRGASGATSRPS